MYFCGQNYEGICVDLGISRRLDGQSDVWLTLHHPHAGMISLSVTCL